MDLVRDEFGTRRTVRGGKQVVLNRGDFGIPHKVRGGQVWITYTAARKWELRYSR